MAKILLVEDNEMNRDMLSRRLQRKGYEVVMALDGAEGLAMAHSERPDLILMDIELPVLDGLEATSRLKADPATRLVPIIGLSAHAMAGDLDKAMEAGCDDYDTKPVELPRLLAKIQALLEKRLPAVMNPPDYTLLVVDDNEDNREVLSRRLTRQGYRVDVAEDGLEAMKMLRSQPFDLALLDIMMPGLNGYEVLEQMKADPELRHIPVIVISAMDDLESVVRCINLGAEDYLPKPFNPTLLKARVMACLEKKHLRDLEVRYLQEIEREKQRADELLNVILPEVIVQELKQTNIVKPRRYDNVAVLFCDIVGFTAYCEKNDPESVLADLQQLVTDFEDIILQHQMQKIKTIGDSFMATAGLLEPLNNPVLNAVRCGLAMRDKVRNLQAGWHVRVGIHVGTLVAGVVGRRQYLFDVYGDTVNTAARIESHGVDDAVNVSSEAWARIAHLCRSESLGFTPVKGKGELEIIRVDGLIPADTLSS